MKHCPTCSTNFTDEALSFCLDDGAVLLPGPAPLSADAQATRVFAEPPPTEVMPPPRPTEYAPGPTPSSPPIAPEPYRWANEAPPPVWTPPPPPPYQPRQQQQQTVAILSLVFGIAGITFGWICGGPIFGLLAVILGLVALSQIKKNPVRNGGKPMAIGGMITGGIVLLINLAILAFWIVMLAIGSVSR
jgi:hypothetical protein